MEEKEIIKPLVEAVQRYGVRGVASNIGKAYSSLAGELNLNESSRFAKLGVYDAIKITRVTGDTTWISLLAQEFGLEVIVKQKSESTESITTICAQSTIAFGELLKKTAEEVISPETIVNASLRVRACIRKLEGACLETLRRAKEAIYPKQKDKSKARV